MRKINRLSGSNGVTLRKVELAAGKAVAIGRAGFIEKAHLPGAAASLGALCSCSPILWMDPLVHCAICIGADAEGTVASEDWLVRCGNWRSDDRGGRLNGDQHGAIQ